MVSWDKEIKIGEALESLFSQTNPNTFTSFNHLLHHLESYLGFDISHKLDFIRAQIHFLLEPPPLHHQQPPPKPYFSNPNPHLPPNFTLHDPSEFVFLPPQSPPVTKTEAGFSDVVTTATASAADDPKESTQSGEKRRGGPGGLNKLCGVSPELQAIVGQSTLSRTEIVRQLWAYIRKNNLQDPGNKRKIVCNDEPRLVFETDCTDMFKMNKLLAKHIIPLEPTKHKRQSSKKF